MSLFTPDEHVEFIAEQDFHYDNYSGQQCFLERVEVDGKYGLACVEQLEGGGSHTKILLQPVYRDIQIRKISTPRANFDRYLVFADGRQVGDFTMVLNAWVPTLGA